MIRLVLNAILYFKKRNQAMKGKCLMNETIVLYAIILLLFVAGSIYNFRIRVKCIYPIEMTKRNLIVIIITLIIFIVLAYFGGNMWYHYIFSLSAAILLVSSVIGQGIHKKGIYSVSVGRFSIFRLTKWEDIEGINVDSSKNKIHSYQFKSRLIMVSQYYKEEDFDDIKKFIEKKIT